MAEFHDYERREAANQVLHYFRSTEGYPGGSFTEALLSAIAKADSFNRQRLAFGFPLYVEMYNAAEQLSGGLDYLREVARGVTGNA